MVCVDWLSDSYINVFNLDLSIYQSVQNMASAPMNLFILYLIYSTRL